MFRRPIQPTLFSTTCPQCPLHTSCGGGLSAPCKCMYPPNHPSYKGCANCPYICRERYVILEDGRVDTLQIRLNSLKPLTELRITQEEVSLPTFIPSKTYELKKDTQLQFPWVAVDLKKIPIATNLSQKDRSYCWGSSKQLRQCLRVDEKTKLVAILNGSDSRLERFWGSNRFAIYEKLKDCGVTAIMGPTFSVHEFDRLTNFRIPESEKVINIMRHNQVLQEVDDYFELPIPNLYWRNENDIANWSSWLREHDHIQYISRDLTCGQRNFFLQDLTKLIEQTKRPLHIVLLGIGSALASKTVILFSKLGCNVSIVSSDPIMKAIKARKKLQFQGELPPTFHDYGEKDHDRIALHNLDILNRHLQEVRKGMKYL